MKNKPKLTVTINALKALVDHSDPELAYNKADIVLSESLESCVSERWNKSDVKEVLSIYYKVKDID